MSTASIYKSSLILVNVISCILICFAQAIIGYKTQYLKYLWRDSCLSLKECTMESCTKPPNCSDKIKMPKSTAGCWIKIFIPIENMNVDLSNFSQLSNFSDLSNFSNFNFSHLKRRVKLITKLEYQRKPKWKNNSIEIRSA